MVLVVLQLHVDDRGSPAGAFPRRAGGADRRGAPPRPPAPAGDRRRDRPIPRDRRPRDRPRARAPRQLRHGSAERVDHAVQARGPVQHVLVETVVPAAGRTVDLATGSERPTRSTQEVWWDVRSGFAETVYRQDGRIAGDVVEQQCQPIGKFRFCPPPSPFDLRQRGLGWPPKRRSRAASEPAPSADIELSGSKGSSSPVRASARTRRAANLPTTPLRTVRLRCDQRRGHRGCSRSTL